MWRLTCFRRKEFEMFRYSTIHTFLSASYCRRLMPSMGFHRAPTRETRSAMAVPPRMYRPIQVTRRIRRSFRPRFWSCRRLPTCRSGRRTRRAPAVVRASLSVGRYCDRCWLASAMTHLTCKCDNYHTDQGAGLLFNISPPYPRMPASCRFHR